ncbi:MAG: adenosylmethionine--8-amino-7-oxononanoate transaminase [Brumimicrobium sp.]|nr:adenosylmethionine--8-amino-7-oxononanoate transaminase [Brumimicrobium sp.]
MNLIERDKKVVWHPFTQAKTERDPLPIVRAEGSLLFDENGKSYIDCNSSWWVNVHGHGHPHIGKAISEQFQKIDHVLLAGATHPKVVELAERVLNVLPTGFSKVFYSDNGSTAVEVAIKMVMQYWYNKGKEKKRFLALEGAYHGDTFGAMSLGQRGYFNKPFEEFFFDADYIPFPSEDKEKECIQMADDLFKSGDFAGVIVEPLVQGSAGMQMYRPEFLDELMKLAKKHEVLFIFDEVMTGWGRTGEMFAMNHCKSTPDIVCLSKGITGGTLPLGLTVAKQHIYDAFLDDDKMKALLHGHSYTGNPLACAAACATIELFEKEEAKQNIQRICEQHKTFRKKIDGKYNLRDLRQCGTILAIEIEIGEGSSYFSSVREKAIEHFYSNGMLLRPLGNVLFLNPPYCTTDEQLQHCYGKIEEFLRKLS